MPTFTMPSDCGANLGILINFIAILGKTNKIFGGNWNYSGGYREKSGKYLLDDRFQIDSKF